MHGRKFYIENILEQLHDITVVML